MHSILLQFEVKLEKLYRPTIGFSTEFEVNLKEKFFFFLRTPRFLGKNW